MARANELRVNGIAKHRELYLELRRRFVALSISVEIQKARTAIKNQAMRSVDTSRRLVEAGQATALDTALFELEAGRAESELLLSEEHVAHARSDLAALVGVDGDHFLNPHGLQLPVLPNLVPDLALLKKKMIFHHGDLARLRARYERAECQLKLEVAKQYPDLKIGPSGAGDPGETSTLLGLSLGIQLPLFDRNQQAIAQARHLREEIRIRHDSAANRALAGLDRAHAALVLAANRRRVLEEKVLPQAQRSIDLAHRSVVAGAGNALRLLDAERSHRAIMIEVHRASLAERTAWIDLELAVGKPLMLFPGENNSVNPPEGLEALDSKDGVKK